ncbi:Alcohol dehydrogenase [acceptor] [Lachnellula occidentalis]|uniref:Alcohol dehydrogenase [acceptor] n=1 Tax=Lachnellula occidentalis TaxID=215460 RepID=A0A8H8S749_9HELO|nr:Alcohol dehydrogenase [acceptor] [Lachnellula occidentalis]
MGSTIEEYDFIIVGAGPSGATLASGLARSSQRPSVLLLEAGGDNKDSQNLVPADRFAVAFTLPSLNWGYETAPQTHLKGQKIDYSRGKGLGGSTAINFSCWIVGADEDYDEWARKVGDEDWEWKNVKERMKKIETYHVEVPEEHRKFIDPKQEDHGTNGLLHLSYADPWEKGVADSFIAAEEIGLGVCKDVNSGNPIGMGMGAGCMYKGSRTSASDFLENAPSNLTIKTDAPIAKVLLSSSKSATGVETIDGHTYHAKKEVILSAGALNTPQILMLSGIGPADELAKHNIPLLHEMDDVGKNMQDHAFCGASIITKPGTEGRMAYESDPEAVKAARAQHGLDKTGLLNSLYCSVPMGYFKNEAVVKSEEFAALDKELQEHLNKPTIPHFEIATHTPPLYLGGYQLQPTDSYLCALNFVMNPQSTGTVTLNSANPSDAPIIDPRLASHPFDRRVLIEGYRELVRLLKAPVFAKDTVRMVGGPEAGTDEEIWEYCSTTIGSSWHMCSTVRMGKTGDARACVDTDFKLNGVKNLRVVDLSVIPLLPNNHTQSTAYIVGQTAAEKLIAEYGLDSKSKL